MHNFAAAVGLFHSKISQGIEIAVDSADAGLQGQTYLRFGLVFLLST